MLFRQAFGLPRRRWPPSGTWSLREPYAGSRRSPAWPVCSVSGARSSGWRAGPPCRRSVGRHRYYRLYHRLRWLRANLSVFPGFLFEPWSGPVQIAILVAAYLLCLPVDHVFLPLIHEGMFSWLGGREVDVAFGVSLGQIFRPSLLLVIQTGLIILNLQDVLGRGEEARLRGDNGVMCRKSDSGLSGPVSRPVTQRSQA